MKICNSNNANVVQFELSSKWLIWNYWIDTLITFYSANSKIGVVFSKYVLKPTTLTRSSVESKTSSSSSDDKMSHILFGNVYSRVSSTVQIWCSLEKKSLECRTALFVVVFNFIVARNKSLTEMSCLDFDILLFDCFGQNYKQFSLTLIELVC